MQRKNNLLILLVFVFLGAPNLQAQTQHHPFYDLEKKVHFGFSIGTNLSSVKYGLSENFYNNDTLSRINSSVIPGISLGAICNFHFGERLDLRLIPSLHLSQRNVDFTFRNGLEEIRTIESVYANLPVLLKYKSTRHNNVRFYVLGGMQYSYDIASKEGAEKDFFEPNIAFKKNNLSYVWGFGFDLYFPYFKFSPEIRIANGLTDVLDPHESVYSDSFTKMRNRMIVISFNFE